MKNNLKAISWMLIHIISAVIININYRLLGQHFEKVYISSLYNTLALLVLLPLAIIFRKHIHKSQLWYIHISRAACYVIAQLLLIYAYNNMNFIEVTSITLTYPLVAVVAATIFLKEKIDINRIIALIIGFTGASIIINPIYASFSVYSLFTLFAVILWVVFDILVKKFEQEHYFTQFFYLILFMALLSIIPATFVSVPLPEIFSLWIFVPAGFLVIIYMFSELMSIISTDSLGITVPFYFINLILASIVGYYLFDEFISIRILVGSSLILAATGYIVHKEYYVSQSKKSNLL